MIETEMKKLLCDSANKLRGAMSATEYKFPVLGLVFLKYVSDIFNDQGKVVQYQLDDTDSPLFVDEGYHEDTYAVLCEDRDDYKQYNVFWIPEEARFSTLLKKSNDPHLGVLLDNAMAAIERENEKLHGVLYRDFARLPLEDGVLGDLMGIIAKMKFDPEQHTSRDIFGEVYEYFLGNFDLSEGQRTGQFYTPRSVVSMLVEILTPFSGRIYDPACGSGGMFVYSERFIEAHGGTKGQSVIYGQELSATTHKLACMNLAIRSINYDMGKSHGDTFHNDQHPDLHADYVLANPPFNIRGWGSKKLASDPRWKYGVPPDGNANYAWLQHMLSRLSSEGRAGIVLANGSMTTNTSGEGNIRAAMVKDDVVECMVDLPCQLFANTQIHACLWFLSRNKGAGKNGKQDRHKQVLFIDARKLASLISGSRKQKEFSEAEIKQIALTYHNWRGTQWGEGNYEDVPGFCKSVTLAEIEQHGYALTPGRYVGATDVEDDDELFEEQMAKLTSELSALFKRGVELVSEVRTQLARVGYGV